MTRQTRWCLLIVGIMIGLCRPSFGANREVLFSNSSSEELHNIVTRIQDDETTTISYNEISQQTSYFVRIAPCKYTVTNENVLADNAILGTKPFVFITTPEGIYGKSLLEIYLDIGYEAEDIIRWQRDQDMVAIVFRYPQPIEISHHPDMLEDEWKHTVIIPTWKNMFALFHALAAEATIEAERSDEFAPDRLFFQSDAQKSFVLSFPGAGLERIQQTGYAQLKAVGGADWVYRNLMEKKLSMFEHFRGNGRTLNEIVDPDGDHHETGILEFVGPNMPLKNLEEIAVIHLGSLHIEEGDGILR